jgi:uncharacterized protein
MQHTQALVHRPVPPPWWKFGHVWLVIAGPVIVVIAGFITLYLAISSPDPVVSEDYYRQGIEINRRDGASGKSPGALAPAMQARNHAATGVPPTSGAAAKP